MALFSGRDRTGTNFDFNGDGSSAAFNMGAAVASKILTVLAGNQTLAVGTGADTTLTVPSGATHALAVVDTGGVTSSLGRTARARPARWGCWSRRGPSSSSRTWRA